MKIKKFIKKWNVAFEDWEEKREFAIEMEDDIREIVKASMSLFLGTIFSLWNPLMIYGLNF